MKLLFGEHWPITFAIALLGSALLVASRFWRIRASGVKIHPRNLRFTWRQPKPPSEN